MKNSFKFFSMALAASLMAFTACTEPEPDEPDTPSTPKYTVTVNCNNATFGTVMGGGTYDEGTTVTISATPNDGYKFVNWNGTISENPYTFTVSENVTYTATFEEVPQESYSATFDGAVLDMAGYHTSESGSVTGMSYAWLFQAANRAEGDQVYFPYLVLWMDGTSASALTVSNRTELYRSTYYTASGNQYGDWQFKSVDNINCTRLDMTDYTLSVTASVTMYDLGPIARQEASSVDECPTGTLAYSISNMVFAPSNSKGALKKTFQLQ